MATRSATYLFGNPRAALTKTDALIKAQPKNPYFQELRGDILMKANKPKDAADAYAKAVSLDPAKSGMLPVSLRPGADGDRHAGLAEEGGRADQQRPRRATSENCVGYRYLAQAYGQLGDIAEAELATAEGHFYSGDYQDAKIFAMRAQQKIEARRAGLGSRAGHHQLQAIRQEEVNLPAARCDIAATGTGKKDTGR